MTWDDGIALVTGFIAVVLVLRDQHHGRTNPNQKNHSDGELP